MSWWSTTRKGYANGGIQRHPRCRPRVQANDLFRTFYRGTIADTPDIDTDANCTIDRPRMNFRLNKVADVHSRSRQNSPLRMRACEEAHYKQLRRVHHALLRRCTGWQNETRTDLVLSYPIETRCLRERRARKPAESTVSN